MIFSQNGQWSLLNETSNQNGQRNGQWCLLNGIFNQNGQ